MEPSAFTFPELNKELREFEEKYKFEHIAICPTTKSSNLKFKKDRICRFCSRDYSQTKFTKEAHVIPHLLGNKYLVSDFECDACNEVFSRYENDLANYLGMSRTFFGVPTRKKFPTFKSFGQDLTAKRTDFNGIPDGTKVSINDLDKNRFRISDQEGKAEIEYLKQPFKPLFVYKAFLKIALSVIPPEYVEGYKIVFKYLLSSEYDKELASFAKILYYQVDTKHGVSRPYCILFKKINPKLKTTTHTFALYFQNQIFEFPIPLFDEDIKLGLYNGESYTISLCPPILLKSPEPNSFFEREIKDFSSANVVQEVEMVSFSFSPNSLSNATIIDLETEEVKDQKFSLNNISDIYFAPDDSAIQINQKKKEDNK